MENQENIQRRTEYSEMLENTSNATDYIYRKQNDKLQDLLDEKKPVSTYDLLSVANGSGNDDAFERVMKAPGLENEANEIVKQSFDTFLYSAISNNKPDTVKYLLDNASNGRFEIATNEEHYASSDERFSFIKNLGALQAAGNGYKEVVEIIVQSAENDGHRFNVNELEQFKHFAKNACSPESNSKDTVKFLSGKISQQKAEISKARTATKSRSQSMSI